LSLNFSCGQFGNSNSNNKNTRKTKKEEMKKEISIIGVGDIMLGSNYPSEELLPNTNILQNVEGILRDADITTGNLEGTLFDKGGDAKTCDNPSVCYVFRMPSKYGEYLKNAGFDYLSLANNHSNDFGETGISETMKNLDGLGIKYSGIKDKIEYSILEKDGIKYGFVSFAPNSKTVDINDYEYASNLIKSVKEKSDIVVVFFHGGAEGKEHEHITRNNEIFQGENRGNVFKFARNAVDSGADIVFADSYPNNPNIDADQIEALITKKTKAIVVVHYAGVACDMDKIMSIANKHGIIVIEDAAQAIEFRRPAKSSPILEKVLAAFRTVVPTVDVDKVMYTEIERSVAFIRTTNPTDFI